MLPTALLPMAHLANRGTTYSIPASPGPTKEMFRSCSHIPHPVRGDWSAILSASGLRFVRADLDCLLLSVPTDTSVIQLADVLPSVKEAASSLFSHLHDQLIVSPWQRANSIPATKI